MSTNILPSPRKLRLNTLSLPSYPLHRRSKSQLYTPSVRHHPGKRISSIIPCTCSDPSILTHPGQPCLVEILSPSPDSLFLRSKRYGLVSPLGSSSSSASLPRGSLEDEEVTKGVEDAVDIQGALAFQYYLPHISTGNTDRYTDASWVAFDMREANEQARTEEMLLGDDFDLPFVEEDDFNYYPERSPRPLYAARLGATEESLVLGGKLGKAKSESGKMMEKLQKEKSARAVERTRRKFRPMRVVARLARKLSCMQ